MRFHLNNGPVSLGAAAERSSWGPRRADVTAAEKHDDRAVPVSADTVIAPAAGAARAPARDADKAPVIKRLSFVFYGEAGCALVRVYDARTGELLREIPPQVASLDADPKPPRSGSPAKA